MIIVNVPVMVLKVILVCEKGGAFVTLNLDLVIVACLQMHFKIFIAIEYFITSVTLEF